MALTEINSISIKDDSIVNADIKSDAAIALSKLASTPAVLTGSTNNTVCTVTGANAIAGEANLTFDGSDLNVVGEVQIGNTSNHTKELRFADSTRDDASSIHVDNSTADLLITNDRGTGSIRLATNSAERLRIDSSGKVGIGTSSPANELVISKAGSAANCKLEIAQSDGGGGTSEILFSDATSGRGRIFFNHGSNPEVLNLEAAGTIGLSVTTAGKVGLLTTTPENLLHINTSGVSGNGIILKSTNNYYPRITGDANRSGADTYLLHIDGRWNGTSVAQIVLETGADTTNKDDGIITFRTGSAGSPAERMRIGSNGKVGINTGEGVSPVDWLHINTTGSNNTGISLKSTTNSYSTISGDADRSAADNYLLKIDGKWNGTEVARITFESGDDTTNKDDGQINFWTREESGGSLIERFCIEADGDVRVKTGNIEISTSGKGIDFSATSDAGGSTSELLDDYEEGTFTATPADLGVGGNTSSTTFTGYYTKIGRQVTLTIKMLNVDSTGLTGANNFYIQGIPFTSRSSGESVGSSVVNTNWSTNTTWINSSIGSAQAYVMFYESADNTSRDYVICSEVSDGVTDFYWSLTYFTA